MGLAYYPAPGEILVCGYDDLVLEPEMRKARPAVVVGPRLRSRGRLVTIVPFSTTAPDPMLEYHCRIELVQPLPPPFDAPVMWAKCDMVSSVSRARLDRFKGSHRRGAARRWRSGRVSDEQLKAIRAAVLCGLGYGFLTKHL